MEASREILQRRIFPVVLQFKKLLWVDQVERLG